MFRVSLLAMYACAALTACGAHPEELRIKDERIAQLNAALDKLEAMHSELLAKAKELNEDNYRLGLQLQQCGGGAAPAAVAPSSDVQRAGASNGALIARFTGRGGSSTRPFTADGPWELVHAAPDEQMAFQVYLKRMDGELEKLMVNHAGSGSGRSFHPSTGTFYFDVNCTGSWTLEVRRVQP